MNAEMEDRVRQIVRCVNEIHATESHLKDDPQGMGAWLGYMDWLDELHYQVKERGMASTTEQFHAILKEMGELHDRKQKDYGTAGDPLANVRASQAWGIPAWVGTMIRASDKVKRLQTFAIKGSLSNEGVEDSLLDLAVYAILALILYREKVAATEQK